MRSSKFLRFIDPGADIVSRKHPKDGFDIGIRRANRGIDINGQARDSSCNDGNAPDESEWGAELDQRIAKGPKSIEKGGGGPLAHLEARPEVDPRCGARPRPRLPESRGPKAIGTLQFERLR